MTKEIIQLPEHAMDALLAGLGYVSQQRGGMLALAAPNNSGGISSVKFGTIEAEARIDALATIGVSARAQATGSPGEYVVIFENRVQEFGDLKAQKPKENEAVIRLQAVVVDAVKTGEHYGLIQIVKGNEVVQSVGRNHTITHNARNLDVIPKEGDRAAIKYAKDGKGSVTVSNERNQAKDGGR